MKIIVVEPKYQINLGYIARTAMNFGVRKLFIVNPRADPNGKSARMFAKHAHKLLENAKVYKNFDDATRDCSVLIATSGVWRKGGANVSKTYFAETAVKKLKTFGKNGVVGLLIGRDDTGLKREEIEKCDVLAYIDTDPRYPVLNVSHALAVFLYLLKRNRLRLYRGDKPVSEKPGAKEVKTLFEIFDGLIEKKHIRNKKAVSNTFKKMIKIAQPNRRELHAIITALK